MTIKDPLEKIYKSSLAFIAPMTLEETYRKIVQEILKLTGSEYGSIILERNGELVRVYASTPFAYKTRFRKKANTYTAFRERRVIVTSIKDMEQAHPELKKIGIKTAVFIPLSFRSKSMGVITVNSKRKIESSSLELKILKLIGSMASLKIRNVQLFDEIRQALETRDFFISLAAHELRTPVTTIFGYSQLLQEKVREKNTIEARWINSLYKESHRLTLLVRDLLEISLIKAGKMQYHFTEYSLREIVNRAIEDFKFIYPNRQIIFEDHLASLKDIVVGDFDKLLQVVINLLDNAAKFSQEKKKILCSLKKTNANFILKVKDEGNGISKKDLPRIFEGYYRGADVNHSEGMGIGLFLAKNILERHNGSIQIRSRLNIGTEVKVQLPKAKI